MTENKSEIRRIFQIMSNFYYSIHSLTKLLHLSVEKIVNKLIVYALLYIAHSNCSKRAANRILLQILSRILASTVKKLGKYTPQTVSFSIFGKMVEHTSKNASEI